MISIVIVLVGLCICCAGVFLSWHKKSGIGVWLTFVFGFLLVAVGGPLKENISGLSVTGEGLNLKFDKASVTQIQQIEIEESIRTSLSVVAHSQSDELNNIEQKLLDASSQLVLNQLLPFIRSLGFVPTPIIGSSNLLPGTIVSFANGRTTIISASDEAFPNLPVHKSSVAFPRFKTENRTLVDGDAENVATEFECENGVEIVEASLTSIQQAAKVDVVKKALRVPGGYLVQSVMVCAGVNLRSTKEGVSVDASSARVDEYRTRNYVTIGYKLLEIKLSD